MEDFYDQLKRNLDKRPEPDFDLQMWKKMEKKLAPSQHSSHMIFPYLTVAIILLLTLFNGWCWSQWQGATSAPPTIQVIRDTIIEQRTVYLRDTIMATRTIYRNTIPTSSITNLTSSTNLFSSPVRSTSIFPISSPEKSLATHAVQQLERNKIPVTIDKNNTAKITHFERKRVLKKLPNDYQLLATKTAKLASPILATKPLTKRWLEREWYALCPKGLTVGLTGSYLLPLRSGIDAKSSLTYGMELNLTYHSPLQLWLSAQQQQFNFSTKVMDGTLGVPTVKPPLNDFLFKQADVEQSLRQYAAGLRYHLRAKQDWQPFFGVGYAALDISPYQVTYQFDNNATNTELDLERKYAQSNLLLHFILFQTGIHYQPTTRWSFRLGTHYRRAMERAQARTFDGVNVQVGIHYGF